MPTRHAAATKAGSATTGTSPSSTATSIAFGRENHLEQLVRILEEILEFVALCSQDFCCELRRDLYASYRRIFRDVPNLVDLDGRFACKCGLELLSERSWLGITGGKCAHKTRELGLCQIRCEMDAGDTGRRKKLRKTTFSRSRAKGDTVEQNLCARSA